MIILNTKYKEYLDNLKNKTKSTSQDIGTSFEIKVNCEILKLSKFILYHNINIETKEPISFIIGGSFFQNNQYNEIAYERNNFEIDHLVVTPYALFVFESKYYASDREYWVSGNLLRHRDKRTAKVFSKSNPICQLKLNKLIMKQIIDYYEINFPVIGKVIIQNTFNIDSIKGLKDDEKKDFIHLNELTKTINSYGKNTKEFPEKKEEAIKLMQSLSYASCQPRAYDGDIKAWSL